MIEQIFMGPYRICLIALSGILTLQAAGRRASFDDDWRFLKADPAGAEVPSPQFQSTYG